MSYQFWKDARAGKNPSINEADPQPGFYKLRDGKNGPWLPVAIWEKDGKLIARVADKVRDPLEIWTWCAGNPVSQEDAKTAFKTGSWPGDLETISDDIPDAAGDDDAKSELTRIIDQAREWTRNPPAADAITKEMADRAANFDDRVMKLKKLAEVQRNDELEPLLAEVKRLDAIKADIRERRADWKALIDAVQPARGALKGIYVSWQRERSLAGEDTKCGGQYASRKGYVIKNDPLHPDTIKAREDAEAEARKREEAERRAREEMEREAEEQRQKEVLAEAERIKQEQEAQAVPSSPEERSQDLLAPVQTHTEYHVADMQAVMAWALEQDEILNLIRKFAVARAESGADVPGVEAREVERAA